MTDGEHTRWQQGRVSQRGDTHYDYDKAGRLISKRQLRPGFRPEQWHYRWDSRNQLRVVTTPGGHNWLYRYDPFGRRISKRCEQTGEEVRYLWDGDQIAEVRHFKQGSLQQRRHWVWRGWELLVQQRQQIQAQPGLQAYAATAYIEQVLQAAAESWQTDFAVSQQNGELLGLYNPQGELHWQPTKTSLWGQRLSNHADIRDPGLAFAGQQRDDESGLCYNRFRYYDPQGACYISPDPIGIWGGENNYGYVHNPLGWIDPLGLSACAPTHHLATNKHSTWSDRFRELFKKNDLGKFKNGKWRKDVLNDPLNKIDVPGHKGPHPQDMHQEIFDRLSAASDRGKDTFIKEIEKLRVEAITPGSWLNDILTKVGK